MFTIDCLWRQEQVDGAQVQQRVRRPLPHEDQQEDDNDNDYDDDKDNDQQEDGDLPRGEGRAAAAHPAWELQVRFYLIFMAYYREDISENSHNMKNLCIFSTDWIELSIFS